MDLIEELDKYVLTATVMTYSNDKGFQTSKLMTTSVNRKQNDEEGKFKQRNNYRF